MIITKNGIEYDLNHLNRFGLKDFLEKYYNFYTYLRYGEREEAYQIFIHDKHDKTLMWSYGYYRIEEWYRDKIEELESENN